MTTRDDELYQDLLKTFAVEAAEHVQAFNQALLRLERVSDEAQRQELLQVAFRAGHSLKGSARAVNFSEIEDMAHRLESVLQQARKGQLNLEPDICDALYAALDVIKELLTGKQVSLAAIHARLAAIDARTVVVTSPEKPKPVDNPPPAAVHPGPQADASAMGDDTIRVAVSKLDNLMAQAGELLIAKIGAEQHLTDIHAIRGQLSRWSRTWREIKSLLPQFNGSKERQLVNLLTQHDEQLQLIIRDVNVLHQSVNRDTLRLGMVATRVQDEVRRVRMVPFQTLSLTLERVMRDAARTEGKTVAALVIEGGETELDKKVLETLKDPLIHLLRNAVGHGIETPEIRAAAGKDAQGKITLSLQQRGSEVRISIQDDGRGFDLEGLRASSNGTALGDQATAEALIDLAFQPGVSTASELTTIAGRGVGLDVVRQCMETLQGRIVVDSVPGLGTTIQLLVPVSLAMTRGLLVQVGDERYMLPLLSVEKILAPQGIYTVEGKSLISLDGKPWPLVSLAAVLGVAAGKNTGHILVVVIRVAEQRVALLVDDVLTEQELAVKPVSKLLKQVPNVSGVALLGNGQPVVVLNAADLVRSARQMRGAIVPANARAQNDQLLPSDGPAIANILVVDDSITTRTLEKNILQAAGYNVMTAIDGEVALRQLRERDFDLVVSDVQMPNMDGFALTRFLRESVDYADLPIILVTSLESVEDRERGLRSGANAYIVKRGFDQAELLSTIRQLI